MRQEIKNLSKDLEGLANCRLARVKINCENRGETEFAELVGNIQTAIRKLRRRVREESKICIK